MFIIALALAAADTQAIERAEHWAKKAKTIAKCSTAEECDLRWQRGIAWIRANSRFNVSVDQPGLFATYGPIYASTDLSFVLVRRVAPDGSPSIAARAWCGNVISCKPKPKTAVRELRAAIDGN